MIANQIHTKSPKGPFKKLWDEVRVNKSTFIHLKFLGNKNWNSAAKFGKPSLATCLFCPSSSSSNTQVVKIDENS